MDLTKASNEIIHLFKTASRTGELGASTLSLEREIKRIIKDNVLDILEPDNVYEVGKYYEGLGTYLGIFDTYPYNRDYFKRQHHFAEDTSIGNTTGNVTKIKEVLIREIRK